MRTIDTVIFEGAAILPMPPNNENAQDMKIYARFMQHLRCVPTSRVEIKILSAVQFTADILNCSDAHVSKVLVDLGLRARRAAFPAEFLRFADQALMRSGWDVGGPTPGILELKDFWDRSGDDKFASFQGDYALREWDGEFVS